MSRSPEATEFNAPSAAPVAINTGGATSGNSFQSSTPSQDESEGIVYGADGPHSESAMLARIRKNVPATYDRALEGIGLHGSLKEQTLDLLAERGLAGFIANRTLKELQPDGARDYRPAIEVAQAVVDQDIINLLGDAKAEQVFELINSSVYLRRLAQIIEPRMIASGGIRLSNHSFSLVATTLQKVTMEVTQAKYDNTARAGMSRSDEDTIINKTLAVLETQLNPAEHQALGTALKSLGT